MSTHTAAPAATAAPGRPYAGPLFVLLFVAGLVGAGIIGTETYPSPYADADQIQRFFTGNRDVVRLMSLTQAAGALALLVFAAQAATRLGAERGLLAGLARAAGTFAAAFLMLSALTGWVLARPAVLAEPALVRALHDLTFMFGGVGHVTALGVFVGAVSLALRATPVPSWISWLGLVSAALSLASLLALVVENAAVLLPLGRFPAFIWIIALSVVWFREPAQR